MRSLLALLLTLGVAASAAPQTCTGLCLKQQSCPAGQTTSISGTVYTPNGTDPLPNVVVYVPNATVVPFTPGVSCPVVGEPPSGSPLVGSYTAVDGTFTIKNVPVGTDIPLVIQSGRWRRQVTVPVTTACTDTSFSTRMPRNQGEGEIPKFAVATGSVDSVECVLRKVGIDNAEFTNPGGTGRVNLFSGSSGPGALIDGSTPKQTALMEDSATLKSYDVLMLPCQGGPNGQTTANSLANFVDFANSGGRVYSSHYSYAWMFQNPPFNGVVNWDTRQINTPDGTATIDTTFSDGQTLAQWLQLVGATTAQGQMPISTLKHDFNGVVAPTQSWMTLNNTALSNPVMQFVFNTPIGATNQCGRVLFNEYHVEAPANSPTGKTFPLECSNAAMTPQEKLLEFSLFELTNNGGAATLAPKTADFGSQPIGFATPAQTFTWTNNSSFPSGVTLLNGSGDFSVAGSNCSNVNAGASCSIQVVFNPTALGPRTGTLTVGSTGNTLTAALTGVGTPDLIVSSSSLAFGNLDVGARATQTLTVSNVAGGAVGSPSFVTTGDYSVSTNCGVSIAASGNCTISVTFSPTATGARPGTLTVSTNPQAYVGLPATLTGNGVDFTVATNPGSGSVIAGNGVNTTLVTTPIAGFASILTLSCTTNAPASVCTPGTTSFVPATAVTTPVTISTVSQYTVIGYGGFGHGVLGLLALGSTGLLWFRRRGISQLARTGLIVFLLTVGGLSLSGCSGKLPAQNAAYTKAGGYTYTLTATDGFLTHSATYALTVTVK